MILEEMLGETLTFSRSFWEVVFFLLFGALVALYLNAVGQKVFCLLTRSRIADKRVSLRPWRLASFFNLFSLAFYLFFGAGWAKAPEKSGSRGKDAAVAVAGPLFCAAGAVLFWLLYEAVSAVFLRSLFLAVATGCVSYAAVGILPLPGLCGGNLLASILPGRVGEVFAGWAKYRFFIVPAVLLLLCRSGIVELVIGFFLSRF